MNIVLIGYGKMGKAIEQVALEKGHNVILKIDYDNVNDLNAENIRNADVAIEFTGPESAPGNLKKCFELSLPVVCGSTGWLDQFEQIKTICKEKNGSLIYSSNFSIGVNIFFELNKTLASMMAPHQNYEVQVEETHHTQKKDAPSGTAITIAEGILQNIKSKTAWVNHPAKNINELSILSHRIDPAPGTHAVKYSSAIDDIEIIHTAHNRTGFASGAVLAAEYLKNNKGIFSMKQVLGL